MGKGAVDERHPLSVGVIGYFMGTRGATKAMRRLVSDADVILFVGERTNQNGTDSWTLFPPGASYLHLDIDPQEVGRNYEALRLVGDAKLTLAALADALRNLDLSTRARSRAALEATIAEGRSLFAEEARAVMNSDQAPLRPERLMRDLFGLEISEGALVNLLEDSAPAFEVQTSRIKERLLSGTALASDETSVRVGKTTFWTWVFHHADSACFVIRPSRGKAVVREFLGEFRPEFWVSDRLAAQMGWASKDHQVCLAHLLRDIQYAIDAGDDAFAPGMKALLKRAARIGRRRPALADSTLAAYHSRLQTRLDELLKIVPDTKAGQKLQRIIKRFRQNLFVFVTNRDIPPTNNGSEQALRPCVVFRKVTNCFRSQWGAQLYANVRSVVETARRRSIGALQAIRLTLDGVPLPLAA